MIQQSYSWGIYLDKTEIQKDTPLCSQQHYLQWPGNGNSLSVQQQMYG